MKTFLITAAFVSSLMTSICYANMGNSSGGGGVGFLCGSKVYLADTFEKLKPTNIEIMSEYNEEVLLRKSFEIITKLDTDFGESLQTIYKKLTFIPSSDVPLAGDDQIKAIPHGCQKIAIAYQSIDKGIVYYNEKYYKKLSTLDKAFLKYHETFIQFFGGIPDTTIVRELVGGTLVKVFESTSDLLTRQFNPKNVAHAVTWTYLTWENDRDADFYSMGDRKIFELKNTNIHDLNSAEMYGFKLGNIMERLFGAKPESKNSAQLLARYVRNNYAALTVKELANVIDYLYQFKRESI